MDKDKVKGLASLARVGITDKEVESLTHEFESILKYVGEVKMAAQTDNWFTPPRRGEPTTDNNPVRNVMREDGEPHEAGIYTEDLLKAAPKREGDYVKVKQILG